MASSRPRASWSEVPRSDDAVRRARSLPNLRVGLHLALVDAKPVLPPEHVPDLVGPDGWFRRDTARFGAELFFSPQMKRAGGARNRGAVRGLCGDRAGTRPCRCPPALPPAPHHRWPDDPDRPTLRHEGRADPGRALRHHPGDRPQGAPRGYRPWWRPGRLCWGGVSAEPVISFPIRSSAWPGPVP